MNFVLFYANVGAIIGSIAVPIAIMATIIPILILEMYYRDYLFSCRKLKLDPTKTYQKSLIDQKVATALENSVLDKKEQKKLAWFKKYYGKMEGGFLGNRLVSRAKKNVSSGKLVIDYEIEQ